MTFELIEGGAEVEGKGERRKEQVAATKRDTIRAKEATITVANSSAERKRK